MYIKSIKLAARSFLPVRTRHTVIVRLFFLNLFFLFISKTVQLSGLDKVIKVLSTNFDADGLEFVSTFEGKYLGLCKCSKAVSFILSSRGKGFHSSNYLRQVKNVVMAESVEDS